MINLLSYFFIYAFIGWCVEVIFAALKSGEVVNRGFLNGPICPIYGVGAVSVIHILEPYSENGLILFIGAVVITSVVELVTGFLLEKLFHQRWWDYSKEPLNIGGYICLRFSLMWGLACLIVVGYVHPLIIRFVNFIPNTLSYILLITFSALLITDLIFTVMTILKLNKKLSKIEEVSLKIREVSDELSMQIGTRTISLVDKNIDKNNKMIKKLESKRDALLESGFFGQKRMINAYPKMKSTKYNKALQKLKAYIRKNKDKDKEQK